MSIESHQSPKSDTVETVDDASVVEAQGEGENVGGTETQLAESESVLRAIDEHPVLGSSEFRSKIAALTETAKTDWDSYTAGIETLASNWPAAREILQKSSIDKTKAVENGARLLMTGRSEEQAEGAKLLRGLDSESQEFAAEKYFASTVGNGEMPILGSLKEQYEVYQNLKGTAFAAKFKELEDARLKKYGYGGFNL